MVTSCESKLKIENQSVLSFKQSYYHRWTSGIKGGGSGIDIFLVLKSGVDLKENDVLVDGVYFQGFYTALKFHAPNKLQGVIITKENLGDSFDTLGGTSKRNESEKKIDENIEVPFQLENDEAVISYKEKGIQKFFKITLIKKEITSQPM